MRFYQDLYWQSTLSCNTEMLASSCIQLDQWVMDNLTNNPDPLPEKFHIYDVYNNYNFFAYPLPGINDLYQQVCANFSKISDTEDMWIKAWVNVYKSGVYHDWHQHKTHTWLNDLDFEPQHPSWHGIYCVVSDDTCTTYKHSTTQKTVHIPWESNKLAIIENQDDWVHRTWKPQLGQHRITIAFNIFHRESIDPFRYTNHWLPVISG